MLNHDSVSNFYVTNFNLVQHHKYSLEDINNMMPWERTLYVDMLISHLDKEARRLESTK